MIISDASGQLPTSKLAETNSAGLFFRADNILQERLRELQFMDIKERNYTAQLNKLLVVNLKKMIFRAILKTGNTVRTRKEKYFTPK